MARLSDDTPMKRVDGDLLTFDQMVERADRATLYSILSADGAGMGCGEHDEIVGFVADGIFAAADIRLRAIAAAV
ncbi:hypothetical protein EIK56_24985 [Sphingomonas sp. C8-2]|nr:hypothetical protein EIK56_24985 [Sphingomonas sp. C8-2]